LKDCVALVHEHFIGYYHNGTLNRYIVPITIENDILKDSKGTIIAMPPLITNPLDILIISTLELTFDDEKSFLKLLSQYCTGSSLSDSLTKLIEQKPNVFLLLHLLYQ